MLPHGRRSTDWLTDSLLHAAAAESSCLSPLSSRGVCVVAAVDYVTGEFEMCPQEVPWAGPIQWLGISLVFPFNYHPANDWFVYLNTHTATCVFCTLIRVCVFRAFLLLAPTAELFTFYRGCSIPPSFYDILMGLKKLHFIRICALYVARS